MNEEIFWKAVDDMGWEANGFDYDKIGKDLTARIWGSYEEQQAQEIAKSLYVFLNIHVARPLYRVVDRYAHIGGNDAFDDLINHIIGLGKDEYDRVMANPALAVERFKNDDFKESFAYCFHDCHERAWGGVYDCREHGSLG